ncbi:MAG: peptidylprolyl isomerase [Phycisphaerales bacterium]
MMPRAEASHILVKTEAEALDLKQQIADGASFADLAKKHSSCPSGRAGGSLGQFNQGDMVPEFDAVIFSDLPIGEVSDPVKTQFGYHLIEVQKRLG